MPARLPRAFYARPAPEVARELLGHVLVRASPATGRLAARIVEVEAYEQDDPASHAFRGQTARNAVMFGRAGHLYVYFTYGMHWCMNVVTGGLGRGSAVLLRAGEPVEGIHEMSARRGGRPTAELCAGPARWTQAFGVDRGQDGTDLVRTGQLWIERGSPVPSRDVLVTERIGISVGRGRPWRFVDSTSRSLSRPVPRPVTARRRAQR